MCEGYLTCAWVTLFLNTWLSLRRTLLFYPVRELPVAIPPGQPEAWGADGAPLGGSAGSSPGYCGDLQIAETVLPLLPSVYSMFCW